MNGLPYWLTKPCPTWCTRVHDGHDGREDRQHAGEDYDAELTLETRTSAEGETGTAHLTAGLWQVWRDARPHVYLMLNDRDEVQMELGEAEEAARLLAAPPGEWVSVILTMMEPEPVMLPISGRLRWASSFPFTRPPVLAVRAMPGAVLLFSSFLLGDDQAPRYITLAPGEAAELAAAIIKLLDGAR